MGQKVAAALTLKGITHTYIVHPAARGKIRAKKKYAEHLKKVLTT